MSEDLSVALIKYNKKTWCKSALLGFFVGLAVIVPGISGSTVAIIFKLYDKFLYALGNLFKRFKECATFLLPIAIGVVIGLVLGFIGVKELLAVLPFAVVGLFAGLMCGAFPAVKDELKGAERTPLRVVLFIVGIIVPIAVGSVSAILSAKEAVGEQVNRFASVQWWQIVIALPIGYLLGITQIVPGLSASAILMAIGWFSSLVDSVSLTFWTQNPAMLLVYIALGVGFLAALVTFSKALTTAFEKGRHTAYSLIVGLSLGSIVSMFINGDIVAVYAAWSQNGVAWLDLALGVVLFAAGVIGSYMLVKYQRKHDEESCE
ncbi:MAG: DUF368 domain-containing protein [Clostridia bacterium]|nr:DUF368 domain-containing protein [Clostridia bacterium]